MSDDDRARSLYVKKENAAELPGSSTTGTAPEKGAPTGTGGGEKGQEKETGKAGDGTGSTDPSPSASAGTSSGTPERRAAATRICGRGWSTGSEMRRFWTISSPGQVPPHSTAR